MRTYQCGKHSGTPVCISSVIFRFNGSSPRILNGMVQTFGSVMRPGLWCRGGLVPEAWKAGGYAPSGRVLVSYDLMRTAAGEPPTLWTGGICNVSTWDQTLECCYLGTLQ